MKLSTLKNSKKSTKRVGRGPGSGMGKTSTRGHKGAKSRSGYKKRAGKEGGGVPLFQKLPVRGFSRGRFLKPVFALSLERIEEIYSDGEVVNRESLEKYGYAMRKYTGGLKILGNGTLTKNVVIEADKMSKSAIAKLEEKKIQYTLNVK